MPDAFLRRCLYYYLPFPDEKELIKIVQLHFPQLTDSQLELLEASLDQFLEMREISSQRPEGKQPGTSEFLDYLWVLLNKPLPEAWEDLNKLATNLPLLGTLLKTKEDQEHFQQTNDE